MMDKLFDVERALKGKRKGGTIENWVMHKVLNGSAVVCCGRIVGDLRHGTSNSDSFKTSAVVNHYVDENIVETLNTYYILGKPGIPYSVGGLSLEEARQKEEDEMLDHVRSLFK
jgi:hypothetical protein